MVTTKLLVTLGVVGAGGYFLYTQRDKLSGLLMGGILAGSGLGMAFVGQQYFKENRPVQLSLTYGGLGVTGLGTYYMAKPFIDKLRGFTPVTSKDRVNISIISPEAGTNWCNFGKGKIKAKVQNLEEKSMQVWVGFTIIHKGTGEYVDYAPKSIAVEPMGQANVEWEFGMTELPVGEWELVVACWDKYPSPEAFRIADDYRRISVSELWKIKCAVW